MTENLITGMYLGFCSYTDIKRKEIYVKPSLLLMAAGAVSCALSGREALFNAALGILLGLMILLISKASKGAVGEGDGLILMVTAFFQGFFGNLRMLMTALFLSAAASVGVLLFKRCRRDYELPFAPFLFISFIITGIGEIL